MTNTFVLPSWAEAWCKCDVVLFIRDCLHGSLPKNPGYGPELCVGLRLIDLRLLVRGMQGIIERVGLNNSGLL